MSHAKESSLKLLNSALLILYCLVAVLAVSYVSMNRILLNGLLTDMELVAKSGKRQVVLQELLLDI